MGVGGSSPGHDPGVTPKPGDVVRRPASPLASQFPRRSERDVALRRPLRLRCGPGNVRRDTDQVHLARSNPGPPARGSAVPGPAGGDGEKVTAAVALAGGD